jgi:hypothetical protein
MTPYECFVLADKALFLRFGKWTKAQRLAYFIGFISTEIGNAEFSCIVDTLIQKQGKQLAEFAEEGK